MPKRILIVTDSIARQTGYATVIKNIVNNLEPGHKVAQLALSHIPMQYGENFPIDYYTTIWDHTQCCKMGHVIEHYSTETKKVEYIVPNNRTTVLQTEGICPNGHELHNDGYGVNASFFVIQHFKPDIVIAINDVWAIYSINFLKNRHNFIYIPYLALDSECFPLHINDQKGNSIINTIDFFGLSNKVVVFTEWAKKTIEKTTSIGIQKIPNNILVIPHGVDRSEFNVLPNKDELREKYFGIKPEDPIFLIGSIARNQPRKRLDAIFQTLRILIDKYEKPGGKKFHVNFHCAIKDYLGWDLEWLAKYYNVENRIILNKELKPGIGCPTSVLNELINCYDTHLMLTNSEGWCTYPDTNILTPVGSKRIDSLEIGDKVITHTGKIRNVTKLLTREYDGNMVRIHTVGNMNSLALTPNHNVLILRNHDTDNPTEEWVESINIQEGDFVSLPTNTKSYENINYNLDVKNYIDMNNKTIKNNKIYTLVKNQYGLTTHINTKYKGFNETLLLDKDMCTFIGYYIAEGCSDNGRVRLYINASGDDRIRDHVFKMYPNAKQELYSRNREVLVIYDTIQCELFKMFGNDEHNKHIPESLFEIIYNQNELSKYILDGLFEGDGCHLSKFSSLSYSTVSPILADQVRLLLLKNNIYSKIYKGNRGEFIVLIQGKSEINKCSEFIDKCEKWNLSREVKRIKEFNGKIWFEVNDITMEHYNGTVYNISVEYDESYIAEGVAVHNCLPILETMSCGIPNVISDFSAHGDWATPAALKVKIAAKVHDVTTNNLKGIVDINHAAKQISLLYNSNKMCREYSRKSITLAEKLQWKNVCKEWNQLINVIDVSKFQEDRYDLSYIDENNIITLPDNPIEIEFELPEA